MIITATMDCFVYIVMVLNIIITALFSRLKIVYEKILGLCFYFNNQVKVV